MLKWIKYIFNIKPAVGDVGLVNVKPEFNAIKGDAKIAEKIDNKLLDKSQNNHFFYLGMSYTEVKNVVDTELTLANKRLMEELEPRLLPNDINKVKRDFDFIDTFREAVKISAKKNDENFDKILTSTLKERIMSEDSEEQNLYTQTILTMKKLTKNHLKIIAFLYLLESKFLTDTKTFTENYDKYIVNLINFPNKKLEDLGSTILGNGLAVTYSLGRNITAHLPRSFYDVFTGKYTVGINIRAKISKLDNAYKTLGMSAAFLTPIGKCIGRTYSKDILGIDIIDESNTKEKNILTKDELEKEISNATKNTLRYEELD